MTWEPPVSVSDCYKWTSSAVKQLVIPYKLHRDETSASKVLVYTQSNVDL